MGQLIDLLNSLHLDSNKRGKQFELICKWYLENDPRYKSMLKKIWLWKEWPGRRGRDLGIDLVAESVDGSCWAIQAKAYGTKYSVKKADIDTFLSASSTSDFSYRLMIATTNHFGKNAEPTIKAQEKPVGRVLLHDLENSELDWPLSPDELYPSKVVAKTPQPHQEGAINDVVGSFVNNDRGQLIMACGTGKTLVGLWISEKLGSNRVIVFVPSLTLLSQTLRAWCYSSDDSLRFLPVCSDDSVRDDDNLISDTSELGIPATTDPAEVAKFLEINERSVVFATYHSAPVIAEAFRVHDIPPFDLLIADEAHRCVGPSTSPFTAVVRDEEIRSHKRLFMTATPKYLAERVTTKTEELDFEVVSMNDVKLFGPVFHTLSFSQAISHELLSDYQTVIVVVTDELVKTHLDEGTVVSLDGKTIMDSRRLATHVAILKASEEYDLKKVVSFHSRVNRAEAFSEELPSVARHLGDFESSITGLWSKYVSGNMSSGSRDIILSDFKELNTNTRGFLANARCLSEGVDVPTLDGIAFVDPRNSQIDIIQAVGRVIRKSDSKKIGTILIPVFIQPDEDSETSLEDSAFKTVWSVIRALKAHDDVLSEALDQFRTQIGRLGKSSITNIPRIILDIPAIVGADFVNALLVKIVENSTATWEFYYGLLERYLEEKGDLMVHPKCEFYGYKLGTWVGNQRQFHKKSLLSPDRIEALSNLSGWSWNPHDDQWDDAYRKLLAFVERENHPLVPQDYIDESGFRLGTWVNSQRTLHRKGRLTENRDLLLGKIPGWAWNPVGDQWDYAINCLRRYSEQNDLTLMSAKEVYDGYKIGMWVDAKRQAYKSGKLTAERIAILEGIPGWTWDLLEKSWNEHYEKLIQFSIREGHCRVPRKHVEGSLKLGTWVDCQRRNSKQGKLSDQRMKLLEQITGWSWLPHDDRWEDGFQHLEDHVREYHTAQLQATYKAPNGFRLGNWIDVQRRFYRQNKLVTEKIEKLENLPHWSWNPLKDQKDKNLECMLNFVQKHGHARVPKDYRDGDVCLSRWVGKKRQQFKKGKLDKETQDFLESLPGWEWDPQEEEWKRGLDELMAFYSENKHVQVPSLYVSKTGLRLGSWVANRRHDYKKGKLSVEKIDTLEKITGWTWSYDKSKIPDSQE